MAFFLKNISKYECFDYMYLSVLCESLIPSEIEKGIRYHAVGIIKGCKWHASEELNQNLESPASGLKSWGISLAHSQSTFNVKFLNLKKNYQKSSDIEKYFKHTKKDSQKPQ